MNSTVPRPNSGSWPARACSLNRATVASSCSPSMPSPLPAGAASARRRPDLRGSRRPVACRPVRTCGGAARRPRGRTARAGQRDRGPGYEVDPVRVVAESTTGPIHDHGVRHQFGSVPDAAARSRHPGTIGTQVGGIRGPRHQRRQLDPVAADGLGRHAGEVGLVEAEELLDERRAPVEAARGQDHGAAALDRTVRASAHTQRP